MPADSVLFIRKGTFEMTRCFIKDDSHLAGNTSQGVFKAKTQLDTGGNKVPVLEDAFIAQHIINGESCNKRRMLNAGKMFRRKVVLPKKLSMSVEHTRKKMVSRVQETS